MDGYERLAALTERLEALTGTLTAVLAALAIAERMFNAGWSSARQGMPPAPRRRRKREDSPLRVVR